MFQFSAMDEDPAYVKCPLIPPRPSRKDSVSICTQNTYFFTSEKLIDLKAKKTHGFNSCIVISAYPLDTQLVKKLQNIVIIDKLTT